jgi:epsilon-lactone hydrolase
MTDDRAALEAGLAPLLNYVSAGTPVVEQRAGNEQFSIDYLPIPDDVETEELTLGGISCLSVLAPGASKDATLLYFHGGGYVIGSAIAHGGFGSAFSRLSGMRVILVNYRLAPEHPAPAAVEDGVAAYAGLLELTPAESIVVSGDSAGGGLSLAVLTQIRDRGLTPPAAAVLYSPWTDLSFTGETLETKKDVDTMVTMETIGPMAEAYIGDGDPTDPLISPVYADHSNLPPTFFLLGGDEILTDDTMRVVTRMQASGGDATVKAWPRMLHVFPTFAPLLEEPHPAWDALQEAADYARAQTLGKA